MFRHIDFSDDVVGLQVPAGTVEIGESPESAAIRELIEETGYNTFELAGYLGKCEYNINPYRNELQVRHFFAAKPTAELPVRWVAGEPKHNSNDEIRFEFFWIPIQNGHVVQSGQGALLARAYELLLAGHLDS